MISGITQQKMSSIREKSSFILKIVKIQNTLFKGVDDFKVIKEKGMEWKEMVMDSENNKHSAGHVAYVRKNTFQIWGSSSELGRRQSMLVFTSRGGVGGLVRTKGISLIE